MSAKLTSINVNVEHIDNKTTYHVELALVVDELRDCERDDGTRSQGKVSVDKRPLLFVSISPATIKTRPEYPQEYSTYIMERIYLHNGDSTYIMERMYLHNGENVPT